MRAKAWSCLQGEQQQREAVQELQGDQRHQDQLCCRSSVRRQLAGRQGLRLCVLL